MENNKKNRKFGGKMKYSSMAIAFFAIFLVGAILLNLVAVLLTNRVGLRWDITDNRLYEISDTTKDLLETLPEDIQITVLATEYSYQNTSTYRPIREVLMRYATMSGGKLSVRYVDPYSNPAVVQKYSELGTPSAADIVFESSKRYKIVSPSDLYDMRINYTENTQQQGLQAEQKFSSAIMYCLADSLPKAVRTSGHDEDDFSSLNSLLSTANYALDKLNLAVSEIPDDTAVIIINNPKKDFVDEEIARIEEFLDGKGSLIVFYDVTCPHLPKFELFMEDWGVKPQDLLVCDSQYNYAGSARSVIPLLNSDHEMTSDVRQTTGEYVVSVDSRAWDILWGNGTVKGFRRATAILTSTSSSYGKSVTADSTMVSFNKEEGDPTGPFYIGVLAEQANNNTGSRSNVLFLSSAVANDYILDNDIFLNRKLLINAINFMNDEADMIIVEARYAQSTSLSLTGQDSSFIFWSLCVFIPAAVLVAGGVVWFRRRNR